MTDWNLVALYLIYGTSFMLMSIFITKERKRVTHIELTEGFQNLAYFGFIHGLSEYSAIPKLLEWPNSWIFDVIKLILMTISFAILLGFGLNIITVGVEKWRWIRGIPYGALLMYLWMLIFISMAANIDYNYSYKIAELSIRYSLGFIGSGISSYAFILLSEKMRVLAGEDHANKLFIAGIVFGLYAIFGGLLINDIIGIPVIVFRTVLAVLITISVIDTIKLFRMK